MASVYKKLKVKKLLVGIALFNAAATPALVKGEDYTNPSAADPVALTYIRTKGAEITYQAEQLDSDEDDAKLGFKEKIIAGSHFKISFEVQMSGSGTATTPPGYGGLLEIAAFEKDTSSGTHVDYTKIDDDSWPDATIVFYFEDRLHKGFAAQANVSRSVSNGGFPVFKFEVTATYGGIVTATIPGTAPANHVKAIPVNFANTTYTLDGVEYVLTNFSCDEKNAVSFTDLPGYEGVSIDDFSPEGEAEIWVPALGDFDPFAIVQSNSGALLDHVLTHGKTAGNIVICTDAATQLLPPSYGDFEGKRTYKLPFGRKGLGTIRFM